ALDAVLQRVRGGGACRLKEVLGNQQPPRLFRRWSGTQEDRADSGKERTIAREPSNRVVARRKRHRPRDGNAPGRRPYAKDAAVARRQTPRAAGVGADREVDETTRDGGGRARGRAAGNAPRRFRVDRRAVVEVLAVEAPGQLVGHGLADEPRAGIE